MNLAGMTLTDLIGALLGFTFTLLIFSYIWSDNFLFRLTLHIFIGVSTGYIAIVTLNQIIVPRLVDPFLGDVWVNKLLAIGYLLLSGLLMMKMSPRLSKIGNPALAFLVGIGAAAAVGGAIMGTLFPQTSATINSFETYNILNGAVVVVGTLATLLYFHFGVRRKKDQNPAQSTWLEAIGQLGQVFIAITFGALFTGVYLSTLAALIERLSYLWVFLKDLILPLIGA